MATRKAIVMAYEIIAANAPLVRTDNDLTYKTLIHSWEIAFSDLDDKMLSIGVKRFIQEVSEVNRSMVISAKIRELALPKEMPFNEYAVSETVNKMISAYHNPREWEKIKSETEPVMYKAIIDYPFEAIRNSTYDQLPTIYAQIRNDYKQKIVQKQAQEHNEKLKLMQTQKFLIS